MKKSRIGRVRKLRGEESGKPILHSELLKNLTKKTAAEIAAVERPTIILCEECSAPRDVAKTGPVPRFCATCTRRRNFDSWWEKHKNDPGVRERINKRALGYYHTNRDRVLTRVHEYQSINISRPPTFVCDTCKLEVPMPKRGNISSTCSPCGRLARSRKWHSKNIERERKENRERQARKRAR